MGTGVYLFRGGRYLRYDRGDDTAGDSFGVAGNWPGLAETGFDQPDAAVNFEAGKVYFFRGPDYVRYDVASDKVDSGYPLPVADHWPGFQEAGFGANIDAAVNWGNGKVYFFKGPDYLRYDIADDKVEPGYPLPVADHWPGFQEAGFGANIDAAVNWGNGKVYFFKGPDYLRYDIADDKVEPGYPLPIADHWPGLGPTGFGASVRAAVDLFDGRDVWLPRAERMPATKNGPKYLPLPWRGVLHTTEGPTIAGALQTFRDTNFWPTLTIEPNTFRVVQHYSLNAGARALSDRATAENAARCVQIEIVGFAAQTPSWAPEQLAFIREVIRDIESLVPIPRQSSRTFLDAAGVSSKPGNRMSVEEWKRYSGWCGHQHVPGESHWDPGALDIAAVLG
ncbi:hemopexin repeat-containing protein [Streptosporangium sp. NPDC000396]|uniref:hemopexin repeat-containing protein n=1 Tax=Streptosporangium sp. NPDC000396 TaxID=3366185 RepID=UPI0036BFB972